MTRAQFAVTLLVAAMAGVLGATFTGCQKKADPVADEKAECLTNMKQLCTGLQGYLRDHDSTLPGADWVESIAPYLQDRAVLVCPSKPDLPVGYAYNEALLDVPVARIKRPAETVALFESDLGEDAPLGGAGALPELGRHNDGVNVGFVDGHVKWLPWEEACELLEQPME